MLLLLFSFVVIDFASTPLFSSSFSSSSAFTSKIHFVLSFPLYATGACLIPQKISSRRYRSRECFFVVLNALLLLLLGILLLVKKDDDFDVLEIVFFFFFSFPFSSSSLFIIFFFFRGGGGLSLLRFIIIFVRIECE